MLSLQFWINLLYVAQPNCVWVWHKGLMLPSPWIRLEMYDFWDRVTIRARIPHIGSEITACISRVYPQALARLSGMYEVYYTQIIIRVLSDTVPSCLALLTPGIAPHQRFLPLKIHLLYDKHSSEGSKFKSCWLDKAIFQDVHILANVTNYW